MSSNLLMSVLCLNVCKLYVPKTMNLGICFIKKQLHLVKVGAFAWYSVKIRVIFGVWFERRNVDLKKQTYTKTEICTLYSRVFWIFLPNVVKIDPYNFEVYRFKFCAFFSETQCIVMAGTAKSKATLHAHMTNPTRSHRPDQAVTLKERLVKHQ